MSKLSREFRQDRALRNAAKRLLKRDWHAVRGDYSERGIGQRMADRLQEGAHDLADDATQYAQENPVKAGVGVIAGIAFLAAFLFRDTIFDAIAEKWDFDHGEAPSADD